MSEVIPHEKKELAGCFEFTPTGLVISGSPSLDEWLATGHALKEMKAALRWWIGDWLNYGERGYGDMYTQEVDERWGTYGGLANAKWVSSRFPIITRRETLTWSHHQEVASLDREEQDRWLDLAEQEEWSRARLRKELKMASGELPPDEEWIIVREAELRCVCGRNYLFKGE